MTISSFLFSFLIMAVKVVIKGESGVGKTCLWHRLQGQKMVKEHTPTQEIQVAHIHWDYKSTYLPYLPHLPSASNDAVMVQVWDVVDRSSSQTPSSPGSSPLSASFLSRMAEKMAKDIENLTRSPRATVKGSHTHSVLDATTVDVIKGASAVVFLFDPRKTHTWSYVKRELPKVPKDISILVIVRIRCAHLSEVSVSVD